MGRMDTEDVVVVLKRPFAQGVVVVEVVVECFPEEV